MTWEEYNALTDRQRAAIDFNTALVQAVRKDKRMQDEYDPSEQQQATYDKTTEGIFGSDGGSLRFAPETVALLQQIEFNDTNADLDDFLGLRTAITERDLKNFTPRAEFAAEADMYAERNEDLKPAVLEKLSLSQTLADNTMDFQQELAQSDTLLQNFKATAMLDRNALFDPETGIGGILNEPHIGLGYQPLTENDFLGGVPQTDNAYFQSTFDKLAALQTINPMTGAVFTREELVGAISEDFANRGVPGLEDKFWAYVDRRSNQSIEGNQPLGLTEGVNYRTPDDFRKAFGLNQRGDRYGR
jgi:hypothetical protein